MVRSLTARLEVWRLAVALVVLALVATGTGFAKEDDPINPDRPGQGNSSYTVLPGRVQLETGAAFSTTPDGGPTTYNFPTVVRGGITESFELRVESEFLTMQGSDTGFAPVGAGFKWNLVNEDDLALGLYGLVSVPSGGGVYGSDTTEPYLALATNFPLEGGQDFQTNLGVSRTYSSEDEAWFSPLFASLCYGFPISDTVSGFVEAAVNGPNAPGGTNEVSCDTGLTWRLNDDLQLDAWVIRGLSGTGTDWYGSVGASFRF